MADKHFKKYKLMHKSISVAAIELDEATVTISSIHEIFSSEHVPLGIGIKKGQIDRGALNEWWCGRDIPASRDGIKNALEELHITSTQKLLDKCFGLSLSDQYWICPAESVLGKRGKRNRSAGAVQRGVCQYPNETTGNLSRGICAYDAGRLSLQRV